MLKRSGKILLEGTIEEFKNYPKGAKGREYVLMNIDEKQPDGSYAFYEKDDKGYIIPVSYKGTEGYDASQSEQVIITNLTTDKSKRIKRSGRILLEGTVEEFEKYVRGADRHEYLLINIKEKKKDGTYALYAQDYEHERVISISIKGTKGKGGSQPDPQDIYRKEYLTFIASHDDTRFDFQGTSDNKIQYSIDNGKTWSSPATTVTVNVNNGDKVMWKGEMTPEEYQGIGTFGNYQSSQYPYEVEGNILSLIYGDSFKNKEEFPENTNSTFVELFKDTTVDSAENLILPPVTNYCGYYNMFTASRLRISPKLPAVSLESSCYSSMFKDCTFLIEAPELPASTLSSYCYSSMFSGCSSLLKAPNLPATTLAQNCYQEMFFRCSNLAQVSDLPALTLQPGCYKIMFANCTGLTVAPKIEAITAASQSCQEMFFGCSNLESCPDLMLTTLDSECCRGMFIKCTKLQEAPQLPATVLASTCYMEMFKECTSLTQSPNLMATTLTTYCYYQMFKDCTSLNYITMTATTTSAEDCMYNWVINIAPSGTFIKAPNKTLPTSISGIPENWTVQDYSE